MDSRQFTSVKEEIFNSITHGLGAILGIFILLILLTYSHSKNDPLRILGFTIFGITVITFYITSTLFHSLTFTKAGKVFQVLDHSFIFLLIAGSYSPFALISFKGNIGWSLFSLVWGLSILGIIFKACFRDKFKILSLLFYLLFGWLAIFIVVPLSSYLSLKVIYLLILGGLFYTIGTAFYLWRKLPFNHGIWHLFVLGGSVCHFLAVWLI